MRADREAARATASWLAHPLTLAALGILLLNDHLLKRAYPGWLTGKLSDVAWLVVAPPVLAAVVGAVPGLFRRPSRPPVLAAAAIAVVGVGFVVVKTTATGAAGASALLTVVAGPSVVLRDPSDLLALPALVTAWVAAGLPVRAPKQPRLPGRAGTPRGRASWWPVVLPLAVLATAATSQYVPEGVVDVDVVGGRLVVTEDVGRYASDDGEVWEPYTGPVSEAVEEHSPSDDADDGVRCVPDDPQECFRPARDSALGVERSINGGGIFRTDWSVDDEDVAALEDRYEESARIRTTAVAVLPTDTGYRVYAANNGDGLAVRYEDGTWERVGFPHRSSPPPVVPLPGEPTAWSFAVPWALLWGAATAFVVLLGSGWRGGSAPRPAGGRWVVSFGLLGVAALVNAGSRVVRGQPVGAGTIFGASAYGVPAVLLMMAAIGLAFDGADSERRGPAFLPALLAGAAVGGTVALLHQPVLATVVCGAVVASGLAVARSWVAGAGPDDGERPSAAAGIPPMSTR